MGLFDKMKQATANVSGNQTVTFTFQALPESLAQMQALPEASLDTPFKTAALTVCALCAYGADKNIGLEMLNWLRGPRPMNGQEISFLNDRFRDGKSYIPFSYFVGASPENGYTPRQPFTLLVGSNHTSNVEEGYCKLFIPCGGADAPPAHQAAPQGRRAVVFVGAVPDDRYPHPDIGRPVGIKQRG